MPIWPEARLQNFNSRKKLAETQCMMYHGRVNNLFMWICFGIIVWMREIIGYQAHALMNDEQVKDAEATLKAKGHADFVVASTAEVLHACVSVFDNSRWA